MNSAEEVGVGHSAVLVRGNRSTSSSTVFLEDSRGGVGGRGICDGGGEAGGCSTMTESSEAFDREQSRHQYSAIHSLRASCC